MKWSRLLIVLMALAIAVPSLAQLSVVKWSAKLMPPDARAGESAQIVVTAEIDKGWHVYGVGSNAGDTKTVFSLKPGLALKANGDAIEPAPGFIKDPVKGDLAVHAGATAFALPVSIDPAAKGAQKVALDVTFQPCNDRSCLLQTTEPVEVAFTVAEGAAREDRVSPVVGIPNQPAGHIAGKTEAPSKGEASSKGASASTDEFTQRVDKAKSSGLLAYLWLAFTMGLLALLTPCVFPMIPITVSFFSKKTSEGERKTDYRGATAYSLGIIGTFTGLGVLVSAVFGASGVQDLATNPWVNIFLGVLFVVLAASLFGVFEIALPSWLVNKAYAGTSKGGFVAPLLMGLTFTLTSFTCTVPFVGTLLAGAAQGSYVYPVLGMLSFSLAFALPFFLLALFPQYLARLPKSGSWLATVKAFMGFLELAAALKFISNVDLVWQWGVLTRPVFLALWASIAFVGGLYLIGWMLLGHDPEKPKIGWPRRLVGLATFAAGFYCLAAIEGANLGTFASFLPPDPYPGRAASTNSAIKWEHDYEAALARAKAENKTIFINFTGVTCTNCRNMEFNVFPVPKVTAAINQHIPLELYTDRKTPEDMRNQQLREKLTGVPSNPVYVILSPEGTVVRVLQGAEPDEDKFVAFLQGSAAVASNP